jgi:transposase
MGYVVAMETKSPATDCTRCKELEKQVAELASEVKRLAKKLESKTRESKRSAAPQRVRPSRKKPPQEHLKSGRPLGHEPASKPTPDKIDHDIEVPLIDCPDCQCKLIDVVIHNQFQSDLPPIVPMVTKFRVPVGTCPRCMKRVQSTHPDQSSQALGAANHTLGPSAVAVASELKYSLGMPFRKISRFFQSTFGLKFSPGGIVRAAQSVANKSKGLISVLKLQIANREVVHGDETGWWLKGINCYLHCFCTFDIVLFQVGDRTNQTAVNVLGRHFGGTVVCDGYKGYDAFHTARCNSHPMHRISEMLESKIGVAEDLLSIRSLLSAGIDLSKNRDAVPSVEYANKIWDHQNTLHIWIAAHVQDACEATSRLARHLRDYEIEFTKHLHDRQIPPTNNYAEQTLRTAVLLRKIGCCNRSENGVTTFETLTSLFATFAKRGKDFKEWIKERLIGPGPKYVPPILLPADCSTKILLN